SRFGSRRRSPLRASLASVHSVCLPASIRSGSTSLSVGKGLMPSKPLSDCSITSTSIAVEACRPRFRLLSLIFLRIIPFDKSIYDAPPAAGVRRRRTDFELRARMRALAHLAAGAQPRDQESGRRARRKTVRSDDSPSAPDAGRRGALAAGA